MTTTPTLVRFSLPSGEDRYSLGHPLLDRYLEFVAGRARPNTLRAAAFDLKTFFSVIDKDPADFAADHSSPSIRRKKRSISSDESESLERATRLAPTPNVSARLNTQFAVQ